MSDKFDRITPNFKDFIEQQKIFFVGTAASEGRVNVSPKDGDSIRVINENKVVWLNLTGSGNETAAHLIIKDRMTIMFCSFENKPLILRLYGHAKVHHERNPEFHEFVKLFDEREGARQIIEMEVDLVQTSCGYGVPLMDFAKERNILKSWCKKKGKKNIDAYWKENNLKSIDGFETKILQD